jgi:hypothetical protein
VEVSGGESVAVEVDAVVEAVVSVALLVSA